MKNLIVLFTTLFLTSFISVDAMASGSCSGIWSYGYHTPGTLAGRGSYGQMSVPEDLGTQPDLQTCANALVAKVQFQCHAFCSGPEGCAINPAMHASFWTQSGGTQAMVVPMNCS